MQNDIEVSPPIPVQADLQMKIPALYLQFYNFQVQRSKPVKQIVMPVCELSEICIVNSKGVYQCLVFKKDIYRQNPINSKKINNLGVSVKTIKINSYTIMELYFLKNRKHCP